MAAEPPDEPSAVTEGRSPETVDRLMVGICGAIWLVLLAAGVFATVAMVRLGSGQTGGVHRQPSWLLYSIIAVSALVIIGAIPLLIRARRAAVTAADPDDSLADSATRVPPTQAAAEKMRVFGVDPYARRVPELRAAGVSQDLVERLWLRGTVSLLGAMGLALTGVAVGANFLAGRNDTAAWVAFGVAGAITVAMPAVMVFFQRQLGEAVEEAAG
jgi:hypothetical protein